MTGVVRLSLDVSAVPRDPVGAGRYTIRLADALARREDVALDVWCRRRDATRWLGTLGAATAPEKPGAGGTAASRTTVLRRCVRAVAPELRPLRLAWEQTRLPTLLAATDAAVHHAPHYTMPERARLAQVVTVHDLTFLEHPEWHERAKVPVFRRAIARAARRADALVCVSAHTAQRLQELRPPEGRIFVIPHGVDHALFRPTEPAPGADDDMLARLGVRAPYIVFVGTLEPRKAVPDLVSAFDRVADARSDLSLVLAGRPGWGVADVERSLASARHGDRVVRPGYVPDEAVPALLRRAAVAAYVAVEEGFGLPALEALACGTPLVTTAGTAMAEVTGDAALLVSPGNVAELADALDAGVTGGAAVEERRALGLLIASPYTWERSAAGHVEAYRWAAASYDGRPPGTGHGDR
jgi:glycosyltransferase involved in cell wall biosynthesis